MVKQAESIKLTHTNTRLLYRPLAVIARRFGANCILCSPRHVVCITETAWAGLRSACGQGASTL